MTHTITITGDTILGRRVSDGADEQFPAVSRLLRDADVTLTHLEALPRGTTAESYPARRTVGEWLTAIADVGPELDQLGVDVVTLASNHTLDHSYGGLFAAWESLDGAGVSHAGTGWDLDQARAPAFVERNDLTVAVVSATSSFHGAAVAGRTDEDDSRPGVSPLRYCHVVGQDDWDAVIENAKQTGKTVVKVNKGTLLVRPPGVQFPVEQYRLDETLDPKSGYTELLQRDSHALSDRIETASRSADVVLAHVHTHEFESGESLLDPPAFVQTFAREAVDAGADAVVSQGSHTVRGVEVYQQTPIFYDLGGLFRLPTGGPNPRSLRFSPDDEFDVLVPNGDEQGYLSGNGIIPSLSVSDGEVTEVKISVVERSDGVPHIADETTANSVFEDLEELSASFETTLSVDENTATVNVSQ